MLPVFLGRSFELLNTLSAAAGALLLRNRVRQCGGNLLAELVAIATALCRNGLCDRCTLLGGITIFDRTAAFGVDLGQLATRGNQSLVCRCELLLRGGNTLDSASASTYKQR
jgi:hypothetical protein